VIAAVKTLPVRFMPQSSHWENGRVSTYILWDIDGTLIQNTPQAGSLYLDSIEQVSGVRPTVRAGNPHGMTEGQLLLAILEVNGIDASHLPAILERLDELSKAQHEAGWVRDACAGVPEALAAVASRGWTNALLTGNGPNRARYKLLAAGIDVDRFDWEHSFFGAESPTRHHLTADARAGLGDNAAIIVGDTPKDGEAADTAGIPFIAVATGAFTAVELQPTSALVVLDDLVTGLDALLAAVDHSIGTASAVR
jgi:phosphoglycolate phosphatase